MTKMRMTDILPKLGTTVIFHHVMDGRGVEIKHDWPAIVYKRYEGEVGDLLGLTVLIDGVPQRYGKVAYSKEPRSGTWRFCE